MVLPEPAAHDPPDQAVGWLDEIALTLRLSRAAALVLIDKAQPARLGDLVRTLRHDWPDIDVIPDVGKLVDVPPGSTIVLAPRAEDAGWLNLRRGQFSDRKLKVVLWCEEATTLALKFHAPDFYDWIGRHKDCPSGPVPFAVNGLRKAFEQDWPVAWMGSPERAAVEEAVKAALPGEEVVWMPEGARFDEMVEVMKAPGVVAAEARTERQLRRARWARAAAGRTSKVVLVTRELDAPGFWPVHDRTMPLAEACERLAAAGAKAPGRAAALLDLEPEAVGLAESLLRGDPFQSAWGVPSPKTEMQLEQALDQPDPGAAIARSTPDPGEKTSWGELLASQSPPMFRGLPGAPVTRASFERWANASYRDEVASSAGALAAHGHLGEWCSEWALKPTALRAWGIELALRAHRVSRRSASEIIWAVASLGEGDVLVAWLRALWLEDPMDKDLREALQPVLSKISEGHNANDLLALLLDTVTAWNRRAANADMRARADRWRTLLKAFLIATILVPLVACGLGGRIISEGSWALAMGCGFVLFLVSIALEYHVERLEKGLRMPLSIPYMLMEDEERERQDNEALRRAAPLLAEGSRAEAARLIERPLISKDVLPSRDLLSLAARILAETGRAADATRALLHLTGATLPEAGNLRPAPAPGAADLFLQRLLDQPAGVLSDLPDAHLTLVDALLKQGRYPEALLVARDAITRFAGRKEKAVGDLAARAADLERRTGSITR